MSEQPGNAIACVVLHAGAVVGHATLAAQANVTAAAEALGPTLTGTLRPTPAYAAIRETCQQLTRAMFTEEPSEPATVAEGQVPLPPGFARMFEALSAIHALGLQLATPDGDVIPTAQVLIQDLAPMAADAPRAADGAVRVPEEFLTIVATLAAPGGRRA